MDHVTSRKLLRDTEGGQRVFLRDLWMTFNAFEWARWNRQAITYTSDPHGLLPNEVEKFFEDGVRQQELY